MVYVFLAEGFEEVEAIAPVDVLRRAGVDVKTVGIGGNIIKSSKGIRIVADICENEAVLENTDAIILPGGMPGTLNLEKNATVQKFIDYCAENNKYLCAICAAPSIYGHLGLLKGKKAVSFPSFMSELDGAVVTDNFVEHDGNFITARGAGVSLEFGAEIASVFVGREKANAILKQMQSK